VLGCGDPDGGDDALGPVFADAVGRLGLLGVVVEFAEGLSLEHAQLVARQDIAIFARAGCGLASPFTFKAVGEMSTVARRVETRASCPPQAGRAGTPLTRGKGPGRPVRFNWDSLEPAELVELGSRLCGRRPEAFVLTIGGTEFVADCALSETARANLDKAVEFVEAAIRLRLAA
jgi:Ni,Fe-hydrogenase maturation factor